MNTAVIIIQGVIKDHKRQCKKDEDRGFNLDFDSVTLPPLMVGELEDLLEVYHMYKGLCK